MQPASSFNVECPIGPGECKFLSFYGTFLFILNRFLYFQKMEALIDLCSKKDLNRNERIRLRELAVDKVKNVIYLFIYLIKYFKYIFFLLGCGH